MYTTLRLSHGVAWCVLSHPILSYPILSYPIFTLPSPPLPSPRLASPRLASPRLASPPLTSSSHRSVPRRRPPRSGSPGRAWPRRARRAQAPGGHSDGRPTPADPAFSLPPPARKSRGGLSFRAPKGPGSAPEGGWAHRVGVRVDQTGWGKNAATPSGKASSEQVGFPKRRRHGAAQWHVER